MAKGRLYFDGDNAWIEKNTRVYSLTQDIMDKIDSIPGVIDNTSSYSQTDALSANMWRDLQEQINNLAARGRYLSTWNAAAWLPDTNPQVNPYTYRAWDYYIVSNISSGTNYRPHGSSYTIGVASTDVETEPVSINDLYVYDWIQWNRIWAFSWSVTWGTIVWTLSNQTDLQNALDSKVNLWINKVFDSTVVEIGKWVHWPSADSSWHWVTINPNWEVSTYNVTVAWHNEATLWSWNLSLLTNTALGWNKTLEITTDTLTVNDWVNTKIYSFLWSNRIATLNDIPTTTFDPFLNSFDTTHTTADFLDSIEILNLPVGSAYLWQVSLSDMPNWVTVQWDVEVYVYPQNVIYAVMRSAETPPYIWVVDSYSNNLYNRWWTAEANLYTWSSAPTSSAVEWMLWYDTVNDQLKAFDGTNWNLTWKVYTAWTGIDITNDVISTDDTVIRYPDYNWVNKTWATVTLDLDSTITPSANFTVNAPASIKDGQEYVLRVDNWATAYTMTLGSNITNPYSVDLTLTANGIDQFSFLAVNGVLELQPEIIRYTASDFDIKDLADSTWLRTTWSWKQDELIAWTNIQIAADWKTISATDTTYTAWDNISITNNVISADVNTKTFYLSSTSDLTTAQAAYDWYLAGKNPLVTSSSGLVYTFYGADSEKVRFVREYVQSHDGTSYTDARQTYMTFVLSSGTVTAINYNSDVWSWRWLDPTVNYSTPYTPQYNWSPATKKYVDDSISAIVIPTYTAWTWLSLTWTEFSVDSTVVALQSDLSNYYTKTQTYSKTEVDNLIASFWSFVVVNTLPSVSSADTKTIYLLWPIGTWADKYEEWIVTDDVWTKTFTGNWSSYTPWWMELLADTTFTYDSSVWTWDIIISDWMWYAAKFTSTWRYLYDSNISDYVFVDATTIDIPAWTYPNISPITATYDSIAFDTTAKQWTKIWETSVDLTNYFNTSTQTSDAITEGGTNLFLTSAERTKIANSITWMTILTYWTSTWSDFTTARNANRIVYCKVSVTGWYRMAFLAYENTASWQENAEFQYYRSRSSHNTDANQLDEVYIYKLDSNSNWTTTTRNIAAKIAMWTWLTSSYNNSTMTITNDAPFSPGSWTAWQVLTKTANGYEWANGWGWWGQTYYAGTGISIDSSNYINNDWVLTINSNSPDNSWNIDINEVPSWWSVDQVLTKTSNGYWWANVPGWTFSPGPWTTWQILTKTSNGYEWDDLVLPSWENNVKFWEINSNTISQATMQEIYDWISADVTNNWAILRDVYTNDIFISYSYASNEIVFHWTSRVSEAYLSTDGYMTIQRERVLSITKNGSTYTTTVSLNSDPTTITNYISAQPVWYNVNDPFIPVYNYQPATKAYVDSVAGSISQTVTRTLLASWWSGNAQAISVTWVTSSNTIIVWPAPSSISDYTNAGIYCSGQSTNSLTFTCSTVPTTDIVVNIVITD